MIYAALRQAHVAGDRHEAQTKADLDRRITESFSKAIEQLGSDKLEVRLGGIYALERISQESPQDYWTVMENLTAFVRERTQRIEAERTAKPLDERLAERAYSLWETAGRPEGRSEEFWAEATAQETSGDTPATDIAAVLTVIKRRSAADRAREVRDQRALDFQKAVLRRANLQRAHFERANLREAHLEHADLFEAHLDLTDLFEAHLEDADLAGAIFGAAHLDGANLGRANLERAYLANAHLERANLKGACLINAHFERTNLHEAHLEHADLLHAVALTQEQIYTAFGDAATRLPEGLTRPAHWLEPKGGSAPAA